MPKQNRTKKVSGVVYDAAPETSKTNSNRGNPPPGYRWACEPHESMDYLANLPSAQRGIVTLMQASFEYLRNNPPAADDERVLKLSPATQAIIAQWRVEVTTSKNTQSAQAGQLTTWTKSA